MQASQIPTLVPLAFAANGTKNTIPEASQIGITPGAASLNDGFPPLTMTPIAAGGVPPSGPDFNGIFNLLSQTIRWKQAGGQFSYNSTFANDSNVGGYPRGAMLLRADQTGLWLNQTDSNTSNPDAAGAGWVPALLSGVVGQVRNLVSSLTAASAQKTVTADEILVATALGGHRFVLPNFSGTGNLATTGLNGMDTGSAPVSGFVAEYAIYNPTTGQKGLLYQNATLAKAPEQYGGANPVSGYTMSQLTSVWPTNSSGQFVVANQQDRWISFVGVNAITATSAQPTTTPFSIATIVPKNARSVAGIGACTNTSSGVNNLFLYSSAQQTGYRQIGANITGSGGVPTSIPAMQIVTPQTLYYTVSTSGGGFTANVVLTEYWF